MAYRRMNYRLAIEVTTKRGVKYITACGWDFLEGVTPEAVDAAEIRLAEIQNVSKVMILSWSKYDLTDQNG